MANKVIKSLSNLEPQEELKIKKRAGFSIYAEDLKPFLNDLNTLMGIQNMIYTFSNEDNVRNNIKDMRKRYPNFHLGEFEDEDSIHIDTREIDEYVSIFVNEVPKLCPEHGFITSIGFGKNKNVIYDGHKDRIFEIDNDLKGKEEKKYREIEKKYLKLKI